MKITTRQIWNALAITPKDPYCPHCDAWMNRKEIEIEDIERCLQKNADPFEEWYQCKECKNLFCTDERIK